MTIEVEGLRIHCILRGPAPIQMTESDHCARFVRRMKTRGAIRPLARPAEAESVQLRNNMTSNARTGSVRVWWGSSAVFRVC